MSEEVNSAVNNNFIRTYICINDYSNFPSDDPYNQEIIALKQWLTARLNWINENINNLDTYAKAKGQ